MHPFYFLLAGVTYSWESAGRPAGLPGKSLKQLGSVRIGHPLQHCQCCRPLPYLPWPVILFYMAFFNS
jgi:hypothetical protein